MNDREYQHFTCFFAIPMIFLSRGIFLRWPKTVWFFIFKTNNFLASGMSSTITKNSSKPRKNFIHRFSPILYRFISLIISFRNFCAEKLEFSIKISKFQKYTRFQVKWSFDIWRMYNPTSDEFGKKFLNGVLTRVFLCSRLILNRKTLAWTHATYENAKKHSY